MNDLIQKLQVSKKIMDIHENIPRSGVNGGTPNMNGDGNSRMVNEPNYNQTYSNPAPDNRASINEGKYQQQNINPHGYGTPSKEAIMNSGLPEEIKKLMMEHPIEQPKYGSKGGSGLPDDVIKEAARLIKGEPRQNNSSRTESASRQQTRTENTANNNDITELISELKKLNENIRHTVRDTVRDVLRDEGLISEDTKKTNENLSLRVGKHIFEGKVLKIKKVR